jgi:hypothetical protein
MRKRSVQSGCDSTKRIPRSDWGTKKVRQWKEAQHKKDGCREGTTSFFLLHQGVPRWVRNKGRECRSARVDPYIEGPSEALACWDTTSIARVSMHGWKAEKTCISCGQTDLTRNPAYLIEMWLGQPSQINAPVDGWGVSVNSKLHATQEFAGMMAGQCGIRCRYAGDDPAVCGWSFLSSSDFWSAFMSVSNQCFALLASQIIVWYSGHLNVHRARDIVETQRLAMSLTNGLLVYRCILPSCCTTSRIQPQCLPLQPAQHMLLICLF